MVRKSAYETVGPLRHDLIRSQDYEMVIKLAHRFKCVHIPDVLFLQRVHRGARGSSKLRFDAEKQFEVWAEYDKLFFRDLYREIPLNDLMPAGLKGAQPEDSIRACLLQRACIFARKKLWTISLVDLQRAVIDQSRIPLTEIEKGVCRRYFLSKFGCNELIENATIQQSLRAIAETNELGRSVVQALTEPLLWHARAALKQGNLRLGGKFAVFFHEMHGCQGVTRKFRSSLQRNIRSWVTRLG